MIQRLCPDGVEYKKLGQVAEIGTGSSNTQDQVENGDYPFYVRSSEVKRSDTYEFDETAIITAGDGEVGKVFHFAEGKYALHQRAYRVHVTSSELMPRFCYWYMVGRFQGYVEMKACSATVMSLRKPMFLEFPIPVPPLDIQHEVVRVLDSFAELEAELKAELEARKAQYAHYRDKLLSRESLEAMAGAPVNLAPLGELGTFSRGRRFTKADYVDEGIPSIHYAEIYTRFGTSTNKAFSFVRPDKANSLRYAQYGDLVIACTGEDAKDIAKAVVWLGEEPVAVHDDCSIYRHSLNPKYVSYFFQTSSFSRLKEMYSTEAKMTRISAKRLAAIEIPVPPPSVQQKVVDILDRFESLTTSLTDGLSAEIEARRQQYEYYRDRLLDFPRKEEATS